jgi:2-amino-4-hydroxy-6-hydroxymethyldihydropteridine diphosphokinase
VSARAVLGLGANLGSREALLRAAADLLAATPGITLEARSWIWETAPLGPPQPDYLNAALRVDTALDPEALLVAAREVERRLGRERRERWGARTIDVDVLWIDGVTHASLALTVPHPELLRRAFALGPLLEVAPDARDPANGRPLAEALATLGPPAVHARRPFNAGFGTEVLEHTGDQGFVTYARDRADLLAAAAEALGALVVHPGSVAPRQVVAVEAPGPGQAWPDDERMFAWLSEVLYAIDARRFAVRRAVVLADDDHAVRGLLVGEPLDKATHDVKGAIKAMIRHDLEMGPVAEGRWRAQVVVDV